MLTTLRERWMRFWFAPQEPAALAICRILVFALLFLLYLPVDLALWGSVSPVFWTSVGVWEYLPLPVFSEPALEVMQVVWKASLLLSCIGLFTRASTLTAFVLGAYLLGLPHNWGKIHHFDALLVFVFGAMALSRCGDWGSVDAWRRRVRPEPRASGEYRWPIRFVWVTFALIFFAAGIAKLRNSGLEWVWSDNMARTLVRQQYPASEPTPLVGWGIWLAQHPWLYRPLAAGTLVLEFGYPLALFSRRARALFVPGMLLAQIGIRVLMGPSFIPFIICNLFWVPWNRLIAIRRGAKAGVVARERAASAGSGPRGAIGRTAATGAE